MALAQIEVGLLITEGDLSLHAKRMWSISTGETAQRICAGLFNQVPELKGSNPR